MKSHGKTTVVHAIPGKTYTKVWPYKMDGYMATGEVTTLEFEGGWDECVTEAQAQCLGGSTALQVSASVVGDDAGMAKLTVTRSVYVRNSQSTSASPIAGEAGDSEDNPTYSFEVSANAVSILLHPTVQAWMESASTAQRAALQALVNGARPNEFISLSNSGYTTRSTIEDILAGDSTVMSFVQKNPPQFYTFTMILRSTFKVSPDRAVSDVSDIGKIQKPPGPYSSVKIGKNRNFLYLGASYQTVGAVTTCTKSHLLSEEGGWSTDIYGS